MRSEYQVAMKTARAAREAAALPPAVKTAAPAQYSPEAVVQRAWSVFRLPRLQELIVLTIGELEALVPRELLGRELSSLEQAEGSAVAEALTACCQELREASGMDRAEVERARHCELVRRYIEEQPGAWSETFERALLAYRKAATNALQTVFAAEAPVTLSP